MTNKQKNEKYADLITKMKTAIDNEFYYEAILIEYAILEDRTESLLRHAKLNTKDENDKEYKLHQKIQILRKNAKYYDPYIKKHLTDELLVSINNWKSDRNTIIHNLVNISYSNNEIKKIALDGYKIIKNLNNKSTLINKYLDKKYQNLRKIS